MYPSPARRFLPLLCLLFAALVFAGCGAQAESKPELTVFAAASLTDAFEELGEDFERQNPGVEVRFNFAGSSALLAQLRQGAPADVFASADEAKMEDAAEAGLVSAPRVFAKNSPVLIFPRSNPADVRNVAGSRRYGPGSRTGRRGRANSRIHESNLDQSRRALW